MTLDRYRPVRALEKEPTADAFLAQQVGLAGIERLVVLKRLRPELRVDPHYLQLFFEGVKAAGQLRHPNVIETIDAGNERDVYYVVTEYVRGESLSTVARLLRQPLFLAIAAHIVDDIGSALAYAHTAIDLDGNPLDFVHGEISPAQVVVSYDGTTKVGGFGLGRANSHHVHFRPDDLRHRLAYSSPERVRYQPLTPLSDVFSLGVILHELLTGERLFRGKTPAEVIKAVMEKPIPPPSTVKKGLSRELDAVVMGALERAPERRTASADRFVAELRGVTRELGIIAGDEDVGEWLRRELPVPYQRRLEVEKEALSTVQAKDLAEASEIASISTGGYPELGSSGMGSAPSTLVLKKTSPAPWFIVGGLVLALLLGTAFFLGLSGGQTQPAPAPPTVAAAARVPGITIFASPPGASISVDGALVIQAIGTDGVFVATGERETMTIEASLDGHETTRQPVRMPVEGRHDLRLSLAPITEALVAVHGSDAAREQGGGSTVVADQAVSVAAEASRDRAVVAAGGAVRRGGRAMAGATPRTGGATTPAPAPTRPGPGRLTIHVTPPSATVTLDGVEIPGRSPLSVSDLGPGSHTIRASAAGYGSVARAANVESGTSTEIRIELVPSAPRTAKLDIVTTPAGAQVSVDGRVRGASPLRRVDFEPDREYRISVTLEGYRPWSARVTPVAGDNPPLVASLTPAPVPVAAAAAPDIPHRDDVRVPAGVTGNAGAGAGVLARCGACHGVSAQRYTQEQWTRYFATGRHARHSLLRERFSQGDLANAKAYLLDRAADVESARAAGVR